MGTKAVKISAVIFNVIIAIIGIFIICGTALITDEGEIDKKTAIGSYVIGAFVIILAIIGCLAALRESVNIALFVSIFFLLLAIIHIVVVCVDRNDRDPHQGLNLVNSAWDHEDEMNEIQNKFKCCGKSSANDYVTLNRPTPTSCYSSQDPQKVGTLYMEGCSAKVQSQFDENDRNTFIASWVLIAFELIGFLLHLYLFINFRNKQRRLQF